MDALVGRISRGELPVVAVHHLREDSRAAILLMVAGAVVLGLLVALFLARLIAQPLVQLGIATEQVSRGDLTVEIRSGSRDEIGWLEHLMRTMVKNLRQMVEQISAASHTVASSAVEISANAKLITSGAQRQAQAVEQTSKSMEQMAASIQSVAGNTQSLADYVGETSSSINQMGASIEEVARSSGALAASVAEASATIEEMTVSTDQAAKNLEGVAETVAETSATIEEMMSSIERGAQRRCRASPPPGQPDRLEMAGGCQRGRPDRRGGRQDQPGRASETPAWVTRPWPRPGGEEHLRRHGERGSGHQGAPESAPRRSARSSR
jgi:methyl-accepting chemotaxis protein